MASKLNTERKVLTDSGKVPAVLSKQAYKPGTVWKVLTDSGKAPAVLSKRAGRPDTAREVFACLPSAAAGSIRAGL